ncbi:YfjI family protein [Shewanella xiamenensis]|uniref:DUF3987 domain-containing protein n=1 Tax=Shewanella xiamenensis TaxID=332186 RepID=UPI00244A0656|nr:DUF3987 domain-containing protein [Shewanella xiamenensis]MDH1315028.1 YfjI family protein [Shewanella xiamenensis]
MKKQKNHSKSQVQQGKNKENQLRKVTKKITPPKKPKIKAITKTKNLKGNLVKGIQDYSISTFEYIVYDPTKPLVVEDKLPKFGLELVKSISFVSASCIEFAAAGMHCVLSCAIANKFRIRPYIDNKTYSVTPNLSGIIIAEPGSNKSASPQLLMQFINEIQLQLAEKFAEQSKIFEKNLIKQQMDNCYFKKEARRLNDALHNLPPQSKEAKELREELDNVLEQCVELPKLIYSTILTVQDVTLKGLMQIAANQAVPVLIYKDELAVFLEDIFERKNGNIRRYLIETMDGKSNYTNVTANKRNHSVRPPVASILGTTQPSVIKKLISKVLEEKITNDGYLDRLQCIAYPNSKYLEPYTGDIVNPDEVLKKLKKLLIKLYTTAQDQLIEVSLSDEAKSIFQKFKVNLAKQQKSDAISENVKNKLSKYPDMVLSIALICAVLRQYEKDPKSLFTLKTLESSDIRMAIHWAKHYLMHLKKLWGSKTPKMQNALKILKNLKKFMDKDRCFTTRDITQRNWAGIKNDNDKAKKALEVLVNEGVIKSVNTNKKTGRPSEKWQVIANIVD